MKRTCAVLFFMVVCCGVVNAENADVSFLRRGISALQSQRNQAMDALATCDARAVGVSEELMRASVRIKELEDKYEPKPPGKQDPVTP